MGRGGEFDGALRAVGRAQAKRECRADGGAGPGRDGPGEIVPASCRRHAVVDETGAEFGEHGFVDARDRVADVNAGSRGGRIGVQAEDVNAVVERSELGADGADAFALGRREYGGLAWDDAEM